MVLEESAIPLRPEVRVACEVLGLDPLYVANEGKLVAIVPADEAERALAAMRAHELGRNAAVIGRVTEIVGIQMKTIAGGARRVTMLAGEQLPRIC
jgi:hydrogenase expression/formation protein HypE